MASIENRSLKDLMNGVLQRADLVVALAIYVLGTAALFLVDIVLVDRLHATPSFLADWAFFRSIVLFAGSAALLGCEQAVVRVPMQAKTYVLPMVVQASVLCLPLLFVPELVTTSFSGILYFLAATSFAVVMGVCGHFRSHLRISLSQICSNGWKVAFGVLVCLGYAMDADWMQIAFAFATCLVGLAILSSSLAILFDAPVATALDEEPHAGNYFSLLPLGSRFWMFAIVANCVTHLDQILLSLDGKNGDAGMLFSYRAIFLPIALLAVGYAGVVVAPYIRRNPKRFYDDIGAYVKKFALFGGLIILATLGFGICVGTIVGKFESGIDWPLVVGFVAIASLRYFYVIPSAMMSVFATKRELDQMLLISILGVASMIAIYFLLERSGVRPICAIVIGSLVNLVIRVVFGTRLSVLIFNSNRAVGALG